MWKIQPETSVKIRSFRMKIFTYVYVLEEAKAAQTKNEHPKDARLVLNKSIINLKF